MPALSRSCCFILAVLGIVSTGASASYSQASNKKPAATASVSGRVIIDGKSAPGVDVAALESKPGGPQPPAIQTITDADGHYQITGMTAAIYTVAPLAPLFFMPSDHSYDAGKRVDLSVGERVEGVDFKLVPGGVITGRVVDADNRPVIEERITLHLIDENGAPVNMIVQAPANYRMYQTDDRGVYRIYGLPAGRYKVSVGDAARGSAGRYRSGYYPRTYHPNSTDPAKAAIVDLAEGSEVANIDITLGHAVNSYTASGRIVDADTGKPMVGVWFNFTAIDGHTSGMTNPYTITNSRGEFRIEGLTPGRYSVVVSASDSPLGPNDIYGDTETFEILDSDVTNLEFKALHGSSLNGTVVLEGITDKAALAAKLSEMSIGTSVTAEGQYSSTSRTSQVGPDGSFQANGLRPGKASLGIVQYSGGKGAGFSITRIERDGIPQPQGIEIQAGQDVSGVRVFVAYYNGLIRGQINVQGGPLPAGPIFVQLSRDSGSSGSNWNWAPRIDVRGRFLIEHMPPGTYEVTLVGNFPGTPSKEVVSVSNDTESQVVLTLDLRHPKGGQ